MNYSQVTFDFNETSAAQDTMPSVGVRVKSLKKNEQVQETGNVQGDIENQGAGKSTRGRKSLKALDAEAGFVNIPNDETLFQRQYYSIGEVASMFRVNQSLLRFWENEFDIIQPRKYR
jgi:hypothetical protein